MTQGDFDGPLILAMKFLGLYRYYYGVIQYSMYASFPWKGPSFFVYISWLYRLQQGHPEVPSPHQHIQGILDLFVDLAIYHFPQGLRNILDRESVKKMVSVTV